MTPKKDRTDEELIQELAPVGYDKNGDPCYDLNEILSKLSVTYEEADLILEKALQELRGGKSH